MNKRPYGEHHGSHKKPKYNDYHRGENKHMPQVDYAGATERLPPAATQKSQIPGFVPFKVQPGLPELPPLTAKYAEAPFRHKSAYGYDRNSSAGDLTYERLEFLGDAYLELIASRLIYHHYPQLTAGQQSQLRELLVKNETLAEYSRAYDFVDKLQVDIANVTMPQGSKGNKGINKILGDSFEAYVAAIVLGDTEHGFAIAEKWLTALWAPKLLGAARQNGVSVAQSDGDSTSYDPTAKASLQRKILGPGVKLEYKSYQDSIELKGDQLGQNRHFIGVYLTGYGHEGQLLSKGEGKNKVEAGNWAASRAMHGEYKTSIEKWEAELAAAREAKKKAQTEADAATTKD